jgi:hypothetical protein
MYVLTTRTKQWVKLEFGVFNFWGALNRKQKDKRSQDIIISMETRQVMDDLAVGRDFLCKFLGFLFAKPFTVSESIWPPLSGYHGLFPRGQEAWAQSQPITSVGWGVMLVIHLHPVLRLTHSLPAV